MSDQTRSDARENACDPATIDAVAAALAEAGVSREWDNHLRVARALAEAGWLRTAEDSAVLDAAEAETDAEACVVSAEATGGDPYPYPIHAEMHRARITRREAVRARRAAGGTEEQP